MTNKNKRLCSLPACAETQRELRHLRIVAHRRKEQRDQLRAELEELRRRIQAALKGD